MFRGMCKGSGFDKLRGIQSLVYGLQLHNYQQQKILFLIILLFMNSKLPPRIVSHLNLKFLDLKIMSVQPDSCHNTTPLPRLDRFVLRQKSIAKSITGNKNNNEQCNKSSENTKQAIDRSCTKIGSKYEEYTNDVTNGQSTIIMDNGDINTDNILNYLSVGCDTIYRELDKTKGLKSHHQSKTSNKIIQRSKKPSATEHKLQRYETQIKKIEKENELIHGEIVHIYSSKFGQKGMKVKNVRNMRILEQSKINEVEKCSIQNTEAEVASNIRYRSQAKKNEPTAKKQLQNFKNTEELVEDKLKQFNSIQRNLHIEQASKGKSYGYLSNIRIKGMRNKESISTRNITKKKLKQFHLPSLIRNKYENFYESLYKQENKKEDVGEDAEKFSQLKKKMVNNNFDKNFQAFLVDRKIRIPEFLKNLR